MKLSLFAKIKKKSFITVPLALYDELTKTPSHTGEILAEEIKKYSIGEHKDPGFFALLERIHAFGLAQNNNYLTQWAELGLRDKI